MYCRLPLLQLNGAVIAEAPQSVLYGIWRMKALRFDSGDLHFGVLLMQMTNNNLTMENCPYQPRSEWALLAKCCFHLSSHLHGLVFAVHFHI